MVVANETAVRVLVDVVVPDGVRAVAVAAVPRSRAQAAAAPKSVRVVLGLDSVRMGASWRS